MPLPLPHPYVPQPDGSLDTQAVQANFDKLKLAFDGYTLAARLQLNVKDFGAKGDGTTDDAAAIQAAVDAVPAGGGAVFFPPGTYKVTTAIVLPRVTNGRLHLFGDGATISTTAAISIFECLIPPATVGDGSALLGKCVDWVIEGFTFSGDGTVEQKGIEIDGSYNLVIRCCNFNHLDYGAELRFGLLASMEFCRFTNCVHGAYYGAGITASWVGAAYTAGVSNTITVGCTAGFPPSGTLSNGAAYTGKTATTFTGVSGGTNLAVDATVTMLKWDDASYSTGCNHGSHNRCRHYCINGATVGLAVVISSGVCTRDSIYEGFGPAHNIYWDYAGATTVKGFVADNLHLENAPTGAHFRLRGTGLQHFTNVWHQNTNCTMVDTRGSESPCLIHVSMPYIPSGCKFRGDNYAGVTWHLHQCGLTDAVDLKTSTYWVGGTVDPSVFDHKRGRYEGAVRGNVEDPIAKREAIWFGSSDVTNYDAGYHRFWDSTHATKGFEIQDGNKIAFYGASPAAKQTVTGSRGGNAALASLLTALATLGLITDSSS